MTSRQAAAFVLVSLAGSYLGWRLIRSRRRRRRRNPWVTMRNRRRVFIDDEGRLERGLPEAFHGVHIADVSRLSSGMRAIDREERAAELQLAGGRRARTFKHADAVRALLEANPELVDFLESECSHDCDAYRSWVRRGRRGAKPRAHRSEGRFDAINERWERRKGGRKVASWLEAVDATPPPSRRWADFPARLEVLEEATGLRLNLPARAEALAVDADELAALRRGADDRIADLVELARSSRLSSGTEIGDAPF